MEWLHDVSPQLDALIVSCDMLAFGGLVASRTPAVPLEEALERLRWLHDLKRANRGLTILGWSVITRLSITAQDRRSARYWQYLHEYNQLPGARTAGCLDSAPEKGLDSVEPLGTSAASARLRHLEQIIPATILQAYRQVRRRNHAVNRLAVELAADGTFDYLCLCQEDAAVNGPHKAEQAALLKLAEETGARPRVNVYPGADEAGMVLLTRALLGAAGRTPQALFLCLPTAGAGIVPEYEDRPLRENLLAQAAAAGMRGRIVCSDQLQRGLPEESLLFWVNCPDPPCLGPPSSCAPPVDLQTQREQEFETQLDLVRGVLGRSRYALRGFGPASVVDVRVANGGEDAFVRRLLQKGLAGQLAAYAGWNTAGNSIGTALAMAGIAWLGVRGRRIPGRPSEWDGALLHRQLLWQRFTDDWLYQTVVRPRLMRFVEELHDDPYHLSSRGATLVEERLARELIPLSQQWYRVFAGETSAGGNEAVSGVLPQICCRLPWGRLFEVELSVRLASG